MSGFDYILGLFVWTYPALRLARWARLRRARVAVEARVNRALALYRAGAARVEWVAGVRCLVQVPAKMELPDRLYRIEEREAMRLAELWEKGGGE